MPKATMNDDSGWPKGLCDEVAVIDIEIAELESRYRLSFDRELDDLDYYRYRVFRFPGKSYALKRYENAPMPGVTLVIEGNGHEDPAMRIAEALEALRLTDGRILWQRSALGDP